MVTLSSIQGKLQSAKISTISLIGGGCGEPSLSTRAASPGATPRACDGAKHCFLHDQVERGRERKRCGRWRSMVGGAVGRTRAVDLTGGGRQRSAWGLAVVGDVSLPRRCGPLRRATERSGRAGTSATRRGELAGRTSSTVVVDDFDRRRRGTLARGRARSRPPPSRARR
jgi:hypothetical protein